MTLKKNILKWNIMHQRKITSFITNLEWIRELYFILNKIFILKNLDLDIVAVSISICV